VQSDPHRCLCLPDLFPVPGHPNGGHSMRIFSFLCLSLLYNLLTALQTGPIMNFVNYTTPCFPGSCFVTCQSLDNGFRRELVLSTGCSACNKAVTWPLIPFSDLLTPRTISSEPCCYPPKTALPPSLPTLFLQPYTLSLPSHDYY
jgi:hypothetical protein